VSAVGNQLSRRGIQTAVKNIIKESGIGKKNKTCSSKTIRHTAIKTMVENEVELPVIANICGLDQKTLFKYIELFSSLPELKEELYLEGHPLFSS
jgi:site-specific recombinase XerD